METIRLFSEGKIKKLRVETDGAVILITVRPGGNQPKQESAHGESTHVEVGTGSYANRDDWEVVEEVRQKQIASIAVKRRTYGQPHNNSTKKQAAKPDK